ncbi:Dolichyl-phosphate-mannose-protein mannosyltransferase [Tritrichomonas foetus]|uniref:Dolichyl-phosphate-mannose-protein mannosyltransferase n=1 Tax=Tritrichomonas foetus TaxID=1144522 RepID=A0A1J4KEM5_9EUKA|nr:Dolichyl-phosphate-mannose-protein mannosyltransferase [Tritrichomonas foetus]|eukprot:OHT07845.1 Dolichyl-phosphate-mannose-protein mannosyltransferase [Tritrichomonas foetus]
MRNKSPLKSLPNPQLDTLDSFILILITSLAFIIRYWIIFHPDGCVFDEVYFGNFTNFYINSQFYYDIHPPLGKMVAYYIANLSEYDGSINFNNAPKYPKPDYVLLRLTPATFSALCCPLSYLCVRFAGFGHTSATVCSLLVIFDTSLGTEGRHILSDGILHFFSILHITILLFTFSIPNFGTKFNVWHIINAISLGAACSCKNTAWGLMALDAFVYIFAFAPLVNVGVLDYIFQIGIYGGSLAIIQFLVYLWSFFIHFILLPYAGPGTGYLIPEMKQQLISNDGVECALFGKRLTSPGLTRRTIWLSVNMHVGNMGIQEFHDSMSFPKQWPILSGVMCYFWGRDGKEIRCLGNVFSYYFALIGVILCCFRIKHPKYWQSMQFVIGWAVCYFPFYMIPRVMYQYHYCIPLMIGCMAFGASLELYLPKGKREIVAVIVIILAAFGFWLWSPFMYGTTQHDRDIAIWSKRWIDGDAAHQSRRASYYASKAAAGKN